MLEQEASLLKKNIKIINIQDEPRVIIPVFSQNQLAWNDVMEGITKWRVWLLLAYQDIKLRYRRSILGPFWITLSMAITIYSMGYLYGHLFRIPIQEYFPYLVAGMLGWSLLSTTINELVDTYSLSEIMLKQIKLPYSLYIHRIIAKNIIIFFHNLLVIIPVIIFFHNDIKIDWHIFLLLPGLALIYLNAFAYGIVLAMIGARYRDIPQIVKSLITVVFFITPIMWKLDILPPEKRFVVLLNPFYSFIELIRAPLIGYTPTLINFTMILMITIIGMIISYFIFTSHRARIIYWL
ncbi:MAG TPA: ABC transporter permease [Gammaproteobacteria bacterium]|nr:ABC transporter permease [Gammaproteobacteria bacterium]